MYIKTCGDISQHRATESEINQMNTICGYYKKNSATLRLLTYNLLADTIGFEGSPAQERAHLTCTTLNALLPDVCALQEASRNWIACIYNNTNYKFIQPVKMALFNTMTALAYNPQAVTLLTFGERVFEGIDPSPLRRMVWGVFRHKKTDKTFIVIGTHFSIDATQNAGTTTLTQALELISLAQQLQSLYNCSLFVMGDFNTPNSTSTKPSTTYDILTTTLHNTKSLAGEICNGELTQKATPAIDHIFCYGSPKILRHATLSQSLFTQQSDHYPVFCDILIE